VKRALAARLSARVGGLGIEAEIGLTAGPLVVIGENGAGKTSLLLLLLGALPVKSGWIEVDGTRLLDTARGLDVPVERRRLGYVPQDYALFPHLSVRKNLDFALTSACPSLSRRARSERVDARLEELGVKTLAERAPATLSGGEKQRVALARALITEPRALLLDEPLAALDIQARGEVREFLARYLAKVGLPSVVVTHDAADARAIGRLIAVLEAGRIIQLGTWAELVEKPASSFVAAFVAQ
jgi:molybdate transport system ATP-binding protein